MAAAQVQLTQGAAPGTPAAGINSVYANATKQLCSKDDGGLETADPVVRQNETRAIKPQINSGSSAAPTGNVSTVAKMMGLGLVAGFTITPQVTGRVCVNISGMAFNSTAIASGVSITGKYGTGVAPANAAASAGTTFGIQQRFIASTTAGKQGFTCMAIISGLTLGVAHWFDLEVVAVTSGGASVQDIQSQIFEI